MSLISVFVMSLLTSNVVLNRFLGICPFIGTSNKEKNAIGMGISVTFVIFVSSMITYLIYHNVLVPTDTTYLKTVMFILVIASLVQIVEIFLKKKFVTLYKELGLYLPLITTNCAVLGVCLLNITQEFTYAEVIIYSLGSGLGFTLVSYIFASIREKIEFAPIPKSFKGYPIALIIASIMALLFARFTI